MGKVYSNTRTGPRRSYDIIITYTQQAFGIVNPEELREWLK